MDFLDDFELTFSESAAIREPALNVVDELPLPITELVLVLLDGVEDFFEVIHGSSCP